ncbi:histidine phosphatase family protein [Kitasatospora kifunensis]|uniref:Putative phosphoglycerate mutase n=1 Tax=Kitasatospora kifunensis TaxID=58351 RepID=A0A7W7VZG6_KITKI|nr:histidine phosphatase family protein [Kitasatospora kifunensis]MBB4927675.1 putative phosphoglycerate mutase [Kitasatospora kifunensis]
MGDLLLIRHGETEWSRTGRHTGNTDVALTRCGLAQAQAVGGALAAYRPVLVLVSPLQRAVQTAVQAGLPDLRITADLREWDYGGYEGVTTAEIQRRRPGWDLWNDGTVPGDAEHPGESLTQVAARCDRVLARIAPFLGGAGAQETGDVVLVSHGHLLRVLTARYLGLAPCRGALFTLDNAAVCRLGTEHGRPAVRGWNLPTRAVATQAPPSPTASAA